MTTDKIYLGTINDEKIYLSKHSWDCNWYWGFGYLGNSKLHYHFSSYLTNNYSDYDAVVENPIGFKHDWHRVDYIFKETWLTQDDWWLLLELFEQAYRLKKAAEVYRRGAGISYVKDITNQLVSESVHQAINKDLEKVLDTIWNYLLTAKKGNNHASN